MSRRCRVVWVSALVCSGSFGLVDFGLDYFALACIVFQLYYTVYLVYNVVWICIVLYGTALRCVVLVCIGRNRIDLFRLHCVALYCVVLYCVD